MGYSFTIGCASIAAYEKFNAKTEAERIESLHLYPTVSPCEYDGDSPASVWVDDMGGDDATRCPSYLGWHNVLEELPKFARLFKYLEKLVKKDRDDNQEKIYETFIPCKLYEDSLDEIEAEADKVGGDAAKRAYWFVKWSREAIKRYGDLAAFETPGEW